MRGRRASEGRPGWVAVPCSELSDKAASASAAAMPPVGSGLGSAGGGSRGASAFSVCSAPGGGEAGLRLYPGDQMAPLDQAPVVAVAQGWVGSGQGQHIQAQAVWPLLWLDQTPQINSGSFGVT